MAINQEALYNYQTHEREKIEVLKRKNKLVLLLCGLTFIILTLGLRVLILKNRSKQIIISLHQALERVAVIEKCAHSVNITKQPSTENAPNNLEENKAIDYSINQEIRHLKIDYTEEVNELRERLRREILNLIEDNKSELNPMSLTQHPIYDKLKKLIIEGKALKNESKIWKELEETIDQSFPNFKKSINILAGGKLKHTEFQTALLVKCGLTTGEMSVLLNLSKQGVVSRRESLCIKFFGEKKKVEYADKAIFLL